MDLFPNKKPEGGVQHKVEPGQENRVEVITGTEPGANDSLPLRLPDFRSLLSLEGGHPNSRQAQFSSRPQGQVPAPFMRFGGSLVHPPPDKCSLPIVGLKAALPLPERWAVSSDSSLEGESSTSSGSPLYSCSARESVQPATRNGNLKCEASNSSAPDLGGNKP